MGLPLAVLEDVSCVLCRRKAQRTSGWLCQRRLRPPVWYVWVPPVHPEMSGQGITRVPRGPDGGSPVGSLHGESRGPEGPQKHKAAFLGAEEGGASSSQNRNAFMSWELQERGLQREESPQMSPGNKIGESALHTARSQEHRAASQHTFPALCAPSPTPPPH